MNGKALHHPEPRKALRQVLQAWLPLAEAVLGMATQQLPNPAQGAKERWKRLLPPQLLDIQATSLPTETQQVCTVPVA